MVVGRGVVVLADSGGVDVDEWIDLQSAHIKESRHLHGLEDEGQIIRSCGGCAAESRLHLVEGAGIESDSHGIASDGKQSSA